MLRRNRWLLTASWRRSGPCRSAHSADERLENTLFHRETVRASTDGFRQARACWIQIRRWETRLRFGQPSTVGNISSALSDDQATHDFGRNHDRYGLYLCGTDPRQTSNFKRISPFPPT